MARKDSILKLRELLLMRRDAMRKALAGDLSLLKSLREQIGGDVVDAALDASQDEISSQLAEVESRELASIEVICEKAPTANVMFVAARFPWLGSTPCPTQPIVSTANEPPKMAARKGRTVVIGAE